MVSISCTPCTAHDIGFWIKPRQARNPKPLRVLFGIYARWTNLGKLWIDLRFYISIINWLSQLKICYNSFLSDTLWKHPKTLNGVLRRWIYHTCLVKLSLTLTGKQFVSSIDAKRYPADGFISIWVIRRLCGAQTADKKDIVLLCLKNSNSFLAMEKNIKHYSCLLQRWRSSSPTTYIWHGHYCEM